MLRRHKHTYAHTLTQIHADFSLVIEDIKGYIGILMSLDFHWIVISCMKGYSGSNRGILVSSGPSLQVALALVTVQNLYAIKDASIKHLSILNCTTALTCIGV